MAALPHWFAPNMLPRKLLASRKSSGDFTIFVRNTLIRKVFVHNCFRSLLLPLLLCFSFTNYADPYMDVEGEFSFVRLQYDTRFGGDYRMRPWATDFPAADINFLKGVTRLTNIKVNQEPIVLRLDDDNIFDHPFLYSVEMGRNGGAFFSIEEIENLREYLLRGGFWLIDDFWGSYQWETFESVIRQVFPDRPIVELDDDHEVFRSFYDVQGPQMIPAMGNYDNRPEADVVFASNHAIYDDDGRIMVLINWNSDMGDGWEHTYHQQYPVKYANLSYQLGINYLIYALTH